MSEARSRSVKNENNSTLRPMSEGDGAGLPASGFTSHAEREKHTGFNKEILSQLSIVTVIPDMV